MRTLLSLLCLLLLSGFARADEYYCMFFATDCSLPQYCHVWGTFAQMKDDKLVKEVTISWGPEGGWNCLDRRKRGLDFSLQHSMGLSNNRTTCIWGPYEIDESLFKRAEDKYNESGDYKMFDVYSRPTAVNCIHRLCEVTGKRRVTHVRYGKWAAVSVYRHYNEQGLLRRTEKGRVVILALGLDRYKLKYR